MGINGCSLPSLVHRSPAKCTLSTRTSCRLRLLAALMAAMNQSWSISGNSSAQLSQLFSVSEVWAKYVGVGYLTTHKYGTSVFTVATTLYATCQCHHRIVKISVLLPVNSPLNSKSPSSSLLSSSQKTHSGQRKSSKLQTNLQSLTISKLI